MFKENTQSYRIMALISMTGECSEKALSLLIPQEPYRNKLISSLIRKNLITRYRRNDLLGFRLTRNGKKTILQSDSERYGFFLQDGADYSMRRSQITYRIRQHRISETLAIMERTNVEIYRNNKNDFFEKNPKQVDKTSSSNFYLPKEIKAQAILTRKIISSKMTGIWVTDKSAWFCYQSAKELFWWFDNIEYRAKILICSILQNAGLNIIQNNALLFGDTMEQAKIHLEDGLMRKYILDSHFDRFCFVPMDENGIMLLQLLNNKDLYDYLLSVLAEDLYQDINSYVTQDGFDSDGLPNLICIDCDLKRIITFNTQLYHSRKPGIIICFDFQRDAIKEYCVDNISFLAVDSNKIKEAFFSEE